jgi:hypothetical protein
MGHTHASQIGSHENSHSSALEHSTRGSVKRSFPGSAPRQITADRHGGAREQAIGRAIASAFSQPQARSDRSAIHVSSRAAAFDAPPPTLSNARKPTDNGVLQAKLVVGAVNDPLEREADRAAEQVMGQSQPGPDLSAGAVRLNRKCSSCEAEEDEGQVQRMPGAKRCAGGAAPSLVSEVLRSPGQPLDAGTRAFFEPRFGRDFSGVRVHTDEQAAESARSVGARAYTVANRVVFDRGEYSPTARGRHLLAHELAHTLQQSGATQTLRRQPSGAPSYGNLFPEDTQGGARIVRLERTDGLWYEIGPKGDRFRASGNYDFVIRNGEVIALKHKSAVRVGAAPQGHLTLAQGERVEYAGQVTFGTTKATRGMVIEWSNASGHFRPTQAMRKVVPFEGRFVPNRSGDKSPGPQLPVFQPGAGVAPGNASTDTPTSGTVSSSHSAAATTSESTTQAQPAGAAAGRSTSDATPAATAREEIGKPIGPVSEGTPGFEPGKGAGIGGAVQIVQAMQFSSLQQTEIDKFQDRLNVLQPKIDKFLAQGSSVELLLIVEKPDRPDFFCASGVFCDASQFIYFREVYISYVQDPAPLAVRAPRETKYPVISAPGGRDGHIPYVHEGGSLTDEKLIKYCTPQHADHHCEYAKYTIDPPLWTLIRPPHPPVAEREKPKPQLDAATRQALAAGPAVVYVVSSNIVQHKKATAVMERLRGNALFGQIKDYFGGGLNQAHTFVSYMSKLDEAKAAALLAIVRAAGLPDAYSELSGAGDGEPGTLTLWFGRDAER